MVNYGSQVDTMRDVFVYKHRANGKLKLSYVPLREEITSVKINGTEYSSLIGIATPYNHKRLICSKMPYINRSYIQFPRRFHLFDKNLIEVTYRYNKKFS